MRHKSVILLIGLSVLAPGVGAGPSAAPDLESWQIYRNAKYGYEVRYPGECDLWPTGPTGERDGRAIRIARKEHAAPTPVVDFYVHAETDCVESTLDPKPADMDVVVDDVEIDGSSMREVTYRWKSNGEIVFIDLCARDVLIQFHAPPGLHDFRATVWWTIISTFRFKTSPTAIESLSGR